MCYWCMYNIKCTMALPKCTLSHFCSVNNRTFVRNTHWPQVLLISKLVKAELSNLIYLYLQVVCNLCLHVNMWFIIYMLFRTPIKNDLCRTRWKLYLFLYIKSVYNIVMHIYNVFDNKIYTELNTIYIVVVLVIL